jgi:hypothetical protein
VAHVGFGNQSKNLNGAQRATSKPTFLTKKVMAARLERTERE